VSLTQPYDETKRKSAPTWAFVLIVLFSVMAAAIAGLAAVLVTRDPSYVLTWAAATFVAAFGMGLATYSFMGPPRLRSSGR
jgi:Na+(H+)/acetate symporter ActP